MYCPRCHITVAQDRCPQCGYEPGDEERGEPPAAPSDWRAQLKSKLSRHREKQQGGAPEETSAVPGEEPGGKSGGKPSEEDPQAGLEEPEEVSQELERPLFRVPPEEKEEVEEGKRIVTFTASSERGLPPLEKPIIRRSGEAASGPAGKGTAGREGGKGPVSKEILFSRTLAGLIDLSLALAVAWLFTQLGFAWYPAAASFPEGFLWLAAAALWLYFFNSSFFLLLERQTPGMRFTGLRLVGEDESEPAVARTLLRVALFPLVLGTVVGLLWALFDPWCRCLHDRLSQTRILPLAREKRD